MSVIYNYSVVIFFFVIDFGGICAISIYMAEFGGNKTSQTSQCLYLFLPRKEIS